MGGRLKRAGGRGKRGVGGGELEEECEDEGEEGRV